MANSKSSSTTYSSNRKGHIVSDEETYKTKHGRRSFPGCFRVFVRLKYVPSRMRCKEGAGEGNEDEKRSRAEWSRRA